MKYLAHAGATRSERPWRFPRPGSLLEVSATIENRSIFRSRCRNVTVLSRAFRRPLKKKDFSTLKREQEFGPKISLRSSCRRLDETVASDHGRAHDQSFHIPPLCDDHHSYVSIVANTITWEVRAITRQQSEIRLVENNKNRVASWGSIKVLPRPR